MLAIILLVGCTSKDEIQIREWNYEDGFILDPADSIEPSLDIVAAYARQIENTSNFGWIG